MHEEIAAGPEFGNQIIHILLNHAIEGNQILIDVGNA
jgi:hypothetical protein